MPWGRYDCSHRLGLYHPQPPKHKFCMRKTKATDFELASLEIILDQVNADLALPNTPSDLELWQKNLKKDVLDSIAEREAEILAEREAEILAAREAEILAEREAEILAEREAEILAPKLEFHCRVSAKAPKQTAKTTEVPK